MTAQTASYVDAIAHLPAGGTLILTDVSWQEYEQLLADLGEGYGVNIFYNQGRLEIMSPSLNHEMYTDLILHVARMIAEETRKDLESRGSTTFKQEKLRKAVEPDTCFYVQNASRIIGVLAIDLNIHPPPDIVVEVDVSHDTTAKSIFYAEIGVPELWRYDESRARIFHLSKGQYIEMSQSLALPILTSAALTKFLEQSKTEGQSAALRSVRAWLRDRK